MFDIYNIVLLGCGGTGSHLTPSVVNLMRSNYNRGCSHSKLWFVDPDIVENPNLARQAFFDYEQGNLKSFVLSRRFSGTVPTKHIPVAFNIENADNILQQVAGNEVQDLEKSEGLIFIAAVDNYQARKHSLEKLIEHGFNNFLWVSPGNDDTSGQVLSYLVVNGQPKGINPLITQPEIANAEGPGMDSLGNSRNCGATEEGGMQHYLANIKAALCTLEILSALIEKEVYIPAIWFTADSFEYCDPINLTVSGGSASQLTPDVISASDRTDEPASVEEADDDSGSDNDDEEEGDNNFGLSL